VPPDVPHGDQPVEAGVREENHVRVGARADGGQHPARLGRQQVRHLLRARRQVRPAVLLQPLDAVPPAGR
jgi:hypothetical protein